MEEREKREIWAVACQGGETEQALCWRCCSEWVAIIGALYRRYVTLRWLQIGSGHSLTASASIRSTVNTTVANNGSSLTPLWLTPWYATAGTSAAVAFCGQSQLAAAPSATPSPEI